MLVNYAISLSYHVGFINSFDASDAGSIAIFMYPALYADPSLEALPVFPLIILYGGLLGHWHLSGATVLLIPWVLRKHHRVQVAVALLHQVVEVSDHFCLIRRLLPSHGQAKRGLLFAECAFLSLACLKANWLLRGILNQNSLPIVLHMSRNQLIDIDDSSTSSRSFHLDFYSFVHHSHIFKIWFAALSLRACYCVKDTQLLGIGLRI